MKSQFMMTTFFQVRIYMEGSESRAVQRTMLRVSLRDQMKEMRRPVEEPELQSYEHSSTSREAEVAMDRAHISENGCTSGSQGAGMAAPHWKA
ncbi:jg18018 [Pararge aegeria aegeria]|uniref:Jg18018 protein n=1 Tax=Pararge aegeria aegeria TaxID=348720 RepID=A0A8S4RLH4_9NEOP|nr:jg18018 [Pararge aegeria aegeria]